MPGEAALAQTRAIVDYPPDARFLAEALAAEVEFLVSLDLKHLVGNPRALELPFSNATPGDFLAWFRDHLAQRTQGAGQR